MRAPCKHGSILPRGLQCDRGYLSIRLKTSEGPYFRGCGTHTPAMEKIARLALEKIRIDQRMGKFSLPKHLAVMSFEAATQIYYDRHFVNYRDPKTNEGRTQASIRAAQSFLGSLNEFFGRMALNAIDLQDLKQYRAKRIEFDGLSPAYLNRQMAVMSSLFVMMRTWMEQREIDPVRLPLDVQGMSHNPCQLLEDMNEKPRTRVATLHEIKSLREACESLKDTVMWTVINMELETALRFGDLKNLHTAKGHNGYVTLSQGKTGGAVHMADGGLATIDWSAKFANFRNRWNAVRIRAGVPDLQFRDLRKTSMQLLQDEFSPEDIAHHAGHSDSKVTKKWYLNLAKLNAEKRQPMLEALRRKLGSL